MAMQKRKRKFCSYFSILFTVFLILSSWNSRTQYFSVNSSFSIHPKRKIVQPRLQLHSSSAANLILEDTCTKKTYSCTMDKKKFSYIYFLAQPYSLVVNEDKVKPEFDKLNYLDYTVASVSRLAELTTLPILILITRELQDHHIAFLQSISKQVIIRKVVPAYQNMSIRTSKQRHVHTFGKYEVFLPKNTVGFSRLVFMVNFSFSNMLFINNYIALSTRTWILFHCKMLTSCFVLLQEVSE